MSSDPMTAADHPASALPIGTRLAEFELLQVLGVGGFGIVYLAFDHALHREVAVKEYMPVSLAGRTETLHVSLRSQSDVDTFTLGLRSFVNEARLLARFDHPSLVKVHRFWEANGTAYMAMPVYRGRTLKQVRADMAAAPDEAWLRGMLLPLLGAIDKLHGEGVYHRDIAPDNIQIEADGRPVLLDFGAARRVLTDKSQALTAILKPAYAPIEQYGEAGSVKQGPWTDLYALGATLHFMLLGRPPPPATARAVHDELQPLADFPLAGCSPAFLQTIDWMLAPRPTDRPQSVTALLDVLEGRVAPPLRLPPAKVPPADWERTQVLAPTAPIRAPVAPTRGPVAREDEEEDGTVVRPRTAAAPVPAPTPPAAQAAARGVAAPAAPATSLRMPLVAGAALAVLVAVAAGWWWSRPAPAAAEAPVLSAAPVAVAPPAAAAPAAPTAPEQPAASAPAVAEPVPAPAVPALAIAAAPGPAAAPAAAAPASRPAAAPGKPVLPRPAPVAAAPVIAARPADPASVAPPPVAPAPAPVVAAAPAKVLGPKESCGSRQLLALWMCIERACRKTEMNKHPDCIELRAEQERRASPTQ